MLRCYPVPRASLLDPTGQGAELRFIAPAQRSAGLGSQLRTSLRTPAGALIRAS